MYSGLGGKSIRDWNERLKDNEWWASVAASDNNVSDGALMCTFNIDGELEKAHCTFKDTTGKVWDDFDIVSHVTKVGKETKSKKCIPIWLEFPVTNGKDDFQVDIESGVINCDSEQISVSSTTASILRFQNIKVPKGSVIKQAHLQILGAESEDASLPKINIKVFESTENLECKRNVLSSNVQLALNSQSPVFWEEEDEDWEAGSVWVSPDLKDMIQEIVDSETWQEGNTISVAMNGSGLRNFYSYETSNCVSPTLQIEIAAECEQN